MLPCGGWSRGRGAATPAPTAARLEVDGDAFVRDEAGNTRGGVRTPVVDAPVEVLRGDTEPDASYLCQLFGSTLPMDPDLIRARYADRAAYLSAYAAATDAAIASGFHAAGGSGGRPGRGSARPGARLTSANGPDRSCPGPRPGAMIPGVMTLVPARVVAFLSLPVLRRAAYHFRRMTGGLDRAFYLRVGLVMAGSS